MGQFRFIAIFVAALVGVSCATTAPYDPFKIGKEEFYDRIKMIALTPVLVPEDLEDPEPVKAGFESLIEAKLREAGFSIVPSRESAEIFERMKKQLGGFFDPITGKRDEAKFKAAAEQTRRELSTKFNVDAILHPSIRVVRASFSANRANWHGTSESLTSGGFLEAVLGGTYQGTVGALSLLINVEDRNGVDLYLNGGGIQALARLSGGKFIPIPRNEILANEERNVTAVNIALEPLVTRSKSGEVSKP